MSNLDITSLEKEFKITEKTDDFGVHLDFKELLISSDSFEVIQYHYNLLKRTKNDDLRQTLATFFKWRGASGEKFLLDRMEEESDSHLLAVALQILGSMNSKQVLPFARSFLSHRDAVVRERACMVLGWVGTSKDIKILANLQLTEGDINTRKLAATQQMYIFYRYPKTKEKIINNLKTAIESEINDEVMADIIYTAQEILKRRFGLKVDRETRKMIGDLQLAKKKATTALKNYVNRKQ